MTGATAKGEEIELVAVGKLAVSADCFDVLIHGRVRGFGCGGGGSHDGHKMQYKSRFYITISLDGCSAATA